MHYSSVIKGGGFKNKDKKAHAACEELRCWHFEVPMQAAKRYQITRPRRVMHIGGCKSMFCFFGKTQSDGELCAAERPCCECDSCFSLDTKGSCRNQKHTEPIHTEINSILGAPPKANPTICSMTAQHSQLQDVLQKAYCREVTVMQVYHRQQESRTN